MLQLKEKLKDCLNLMSDSYPYFSLEVSSSSTCQCERCLHLTSPPPVDAEGSVDEMSLNYFISQFVEVVVEYVKVALEQFDGYVSNLSKQVYIIIK